MDFGCIDMGCVEKSPKKENSIEKDNNNNNSPKEPVISSSSSKKSSRAKDAVRSSISALNKLTSQITKPPHRKTSPINWFPRKKVEPYLKRKIKMLQEVDGMNSTLDETLGDTNPHYCRILREKMAIREAAEKAIEARKAAMIEASWCRILQAARIDCKEAEAQLSKAELSAAEAFESARSLGVIMNEIPESSQIHFKIESISAQGGGGSTTTDTVSATFETAFEVDKQVAAAVKAAFIKLANSPSINKDNFKELLRTISENPDSDETCNKELSGITSECESDTGSELEVGSHKDILKMRRDPDKFKMGNIVEMMLDRLRCLKEDELASLATIVATCGLNAFLGEDENARNLSVKVMKRLSVSGRGTAAEVGLPSLDKFLVKRLTRLEREVLEAKNARKNDEEKLLLKKAEEAPAVPDLGSMLVKHTSKLEKEVEEAKMNKSSEINGKGSGKGHAKQGEAEVIPSLDTYFVKKMSRLEREVEEARNLKDSKEKENMDLNKIEHKSNIGGTNDESSYESLDKVLVKHVSRLEKEKLEFREMGIKPRCKDTSRELDSSEGSLDQVLVKHKSRLEKEKLAAAFEQKQENDDSFRHSTSRRQAREHELQAAWGGLSLGNSIQPRMSACEQKQENDDSFRHSISRRQAREQELQAAWGGLSLGNSIQPRVSRLEREKAAWIKAEEEERKSALERV